MNEERLRLFTFVALLVVMLTTIASAWANWTSHWERQALLLRLQPLEQRLSELEASMRAKRPQPQQQQQ